MDNRKVFAIWITGLPASGKSTVASSLLEKLNERDIWPALLESDRMREILIPHPDYSEEEREYFYTALADLGAVIGKYGIPVIFDATGHLRRYRSRARTQFRVFHEVYVECPLTVCQERDPKGIYKKAAEGKASSVPGVQVKYEPPTDPAVVIKGDQEDPDKAALKILSLFND